MRLVSLPEGGCIKDGFAVGSQLISVGIYHGDCAAPLASESQLIF